eukprot:scaffold6562_cov163-Amphora_coffeaeformis.AAC.6
MSTPPSTTTTLKDAATARVVENSNTTTTTTKDDDTNDEWWWIRDEASRVLYQTVILRPSTTTQRLPTRVGKRARLLRVALDRAPVAGQYLAFGVHEGKDLVRMAAFVAAAHRRDKTTSTVFHGFDSFRGLPEDWDNGQHVVSSTSSGSGGGSILAFAAGTFDLKGVLPCLTALQKNLNLGKRSAVYTSTAGNHPPTIVLHPGWFEDTVPAFFNLHSNEPIAFVHADADLYSSTMTFLTEMCRRRLLRKGSVIVFDEYTNYLNWEQGEYRAWIETCETFGISFEYICYHAPGPRDRENKYGYQSVGVQITNVDR